MMVLMQAVSLVVLKVGWMVERWAEKWVALKAFSKAVSLVDE